jgi:Leucine-rich repeat (LRR) protein
MGNRYETSSSLTEAKITTTTTDETNLSGRAITEIEAAHKLLFSSSNQAKSQRKLCMSNNLIAHVSANSFTGLKNLVELRLAGNRIESIEMGAFDCLAASLKKLDLNSNRLKSIPVNTFIQLNNLQELGVANNPIEVIQDGSFRGLSQVKVLKIEHTHLKCLPANAFNGLTGLEQLHLAGERLDELDEHSLNTLHTLKVLWIKETSLRCLPAHAFSHLGQLDELHLHRNKWLERIDEAAFLGLDSLAKLDMFENGNLTYRSFSRVGSQKRTRMRNFLDVGNIETQNRTFSSSSSSSHKKSLTRNCAGRKFETIYENPLASLVSLKELKINNNSNELIVMAFCHLVNLEFLHLQLNSNDNNDMETRPLLQNHTLNGLRSLKTLLIDKCGEGVMRCIGARAFTELATLEQLYVQENERLQVVEEDAFAGMTSLKVLNLSCNCSLRSLPKNVFTELRQLEVLRLSHNRLEAVHADSFTGLVSLKILKLDNNRIRFVPARAFAHCTRLEQLNLIGNGIEEVHEEAFSGTTDLIVLDLFDNALRALPANVFARGQLGQLEQLNLRANRIAHVAVGAFDGLVSLQKLDLSKNRIKSLAPLVFEKLGRLEQLRLNGNVIERIDAQTFKGLGMSLRVLDVDNYTLDSEESIASDTFAELAKLEQLSLGARQQ